MQTKSKDRIKKYGEVYTNHREICNMLDLIGNDTYDINTSFLEPACGTGNFLVEILRRKLISCNSNKDIEIACSNIVGIDILKDNIDTCYNRMLSLCKLKTSNTKKIEKILKQNLLLQDGLEKMEYYKKHNIHFDVIIGNPPYQIMDKGYGASAKPYYHKFVNQAISMNPLYMSMIIPTRWTLGGKGLDDFRTKMLEDKHISHFVDFINSKECFPNVDIKGGVCYFLWNKNHKGKTNILVYENNELISNTTRYLKNNITKSYIRYGELIPILYKISMFKEPSFSTIVSERKPYGLETNYKNDTPKKTKANDLLLYRYGKITYISKDKIVKNKQSINKYKIFCAEAIGIGNIRKDKIKPFIAKPYEVCTETYLQIGSYNDEQTAKNVLSYMNTNFFRLLLGLNKISQHTTRKVYSLIPMQDFSHSWTDQMLYEKYKFTKEEINYINNLLYTNNKF